MQQSRTNMSSFFQNADPYICSFPPEYRKIIDQITMLRYRDPSNKVVLTSVQSQIKSTFGTCAYTTLVTLGSYVILLTIQVSMVQSYL